MSELTALSLCPHDTAQIRAWGTFLQPSEDLKLSIRDRRYLNVIADGGVISITSFRTAGYDDTERCKTIFLTLDQAYQLRDFFNTQLDTLAQAMAEVGYINIDECKSLLKFKKVTYEPDDKDEK